MSVFLLPRDVVPAAAAEAPAQTQSEPAQAKLETQEEQAQAEKLKQEPPEEVIEAMEEDKPQPQHASQVEEAQHFESAEAGRAEVAKGDGQQASPMETATVDASGGAEKEKGASGGDGRGVKRPPAAAVVRAAKQARTNQAAGEHNVPLSLCFLFTLQCTPSTFSKDSLVLLTHLLMQQRVVEKQCTRCSLCYPHALLTSLSLLPLKQTSNHIHNQASKYLMF